jgi:hypothetical protein
MNHAMPPKTDAINAESPGSSQSASHFRLTRYKSADNKKLSASPSRD